MNADDYGAEPAGEPATSELALPDGRFLSYCMYGPEDGQRVVFEFGTPSTRFLAPYWVSPLEELGIRLLVAGRPGDALRERCQSGPLRRRRPGLVQRMPPGNVEEFTRARAGEVALRPLVEQLARPGHLTLPGSACRSPSGTDATMLCALAHTPVGSLITYPVPRSRPCQAVISDTPSLLRLYRWLVP
jgi:hypothetical protein